MASRVIMFAAIGLHVATLTVVVTALWRKRHKQLSGIVAIVGLSVLCVWMLLAWGSAGGVIFAAVVLALVLSPVSYRVWRSLL